MKDRSHHKEHAECIGRIFDVCAGLPLEERLMVLTFAWIASADHLRQAQLSFPAVFPAEQARQIALLGAMGELVKAATPDLELQRLELKKDWAGVVEHLRRQLKDGDASS
jgi:hypothetical protein